MRIQLRPLHTAHGRQDHAQRSQLTNSQCRQLKNSTIAVRVSVGTRSSQMSIFQALDSELCELLGSELTRPKNVVKRISLPPLLYAKTVKNSLRNPLPFLRSG